MTETETIKDVTEAISNEIISCDTILAEQKGKNVLILKKIEPTKRFDGKVGTYRLEHRWLSNVNDVHAVRVSDTEIWTKTELKSLFVMLKQGKSLFDFFQLF